MVDKKERKIGILWITAIQFLYLFYYLSYSDSLVSTNVILVAVCLVTIIELVMRIIHNNMKMSVSLLAVCIGSLWAFICSLINGSGLGSATTQTFFLLSICLFTDANISFVQHKKIMKRMAMILVAILAIFSKPSPYRSIYMARLPYLGDSVSINPNCIAMLTFFLFVYSFKVVEGTEWRNKYKKFVQTIIFVLSISYIYLTSARTAMVSCGIFVVLFMFCKYKNHKLTRTIFLLGLCMSLGIVFIYLAMYSSGFMVGETIGGKGFYSGREAVWFEALELLKEHFIFGISNKTAFTDKELLSAHNSLLAMVCYFGVLGLLIAISIIYISFKKIDYKNNALTVSAILSALFFMSFETMITDWSLLVPYCFLFLHKK